ncbi:hypothetical protein EDD15DRAFT_2194597 [Pisolithus albus]|nr:hypothetical protein EDD15DRAFT_2200063 [Pisolithus albus]KAI5997556.1 hypothetical protein EDD15DRAFT_2194597 [Pisolithus albus]
MPYFRDLRASFKISGMNARGSLPHVLNTALEEYHTESTLRYYEIFFDFGTWDKLCQWESKAEQLVAEVGLDIFQHKVVFVSVHSEVSRGDLFAGKDENNEDVALKPNEFMMNLFSGHLQQLVHDSTIFMLSCGPLVSFRESIASLKEAMVQLKPMYTVAFGADRFISAVLKSFIIAYSVRVLIQGHDLYEVFTDLLDASLELRMHSDTFLFHVGGHVAPTVPYSSPTPSVIGISYSWFHTHHRPWGTALPMSCPSCSSIRSWLPSKAVVDSAGKLARVSTCVSPGCGHQLFSYPPIGPYEVMKANRHGQSSKRGKGGVSQGWIKRTGI